MGKLFCKKSYKKLGEKTNISLGEYLSTNAKQSRWK